MSVLLNTLHQLVKEQAVATFCFIKRKQRKTADKTPFFQIYKYVENTAVTNTYFMFYTGLYVLIHVPKFSNGS